MGLASRFWAVNLANLQIWNSRPAPETTFQKRHTNLGRSRALICLFWQRPAFFQHTTAIWRPNTPHFLRRPSNFSNNTGLRPRGRQLWLRAPIFGPAEVPNSISGTHDRPISETQTRICRRTRHFRSNRSAVARHCRGFGTTHGKTSLKICW